MKPIKTVPPASMCHWTFMIESNVLYTKDAIALIKEGFKKRGLKVRVEEI